MAAYSSVPAPPVRAPEVLTWHDILRSADVPCMIHAGNWMSVYPNATQLRHYEVSVVLSRLPYQVNLFVGEVFLTHPEWDEILLMDNLVGQFPNTDWMVQGLNW